MQHPLVEQLRFTRSRFLVGVDGTPEDDGIKRLGAMNSIGWIVGHMAWHEQRSWLTQAQGQTPVPVLDSLVRNGGPATTPPLAEMLSAWRTITVAADPWLDALTSEDLLGPMPSPTVPRTVGSVLLRVTYHYWFHTGEILAIRQVLGHTDLPEFVGDIDRAAPYRPATE